MGNNAKTILENKFRSYIKEDALIEPSDRILLTVSGGVDSMVMMSLFVKEGYNVGVAHCNFQLRGEESFEDEVLVERQAQKFGLPFYNMRFDTQAEMERTGESVQLAARRLRYAWFNELCKEYGYDAISIAHHADDSIETFFINLLRGTGLKGLTGIHKVNGHIIRPLLFASRREILDYAHANHIPFREDSSNRSTKYLRNKIRLGIVPLLRDINPRFTELMGKNISRITDAQLFIGRCIDKVRDDIVVRNGDSAVIDPSKIDEHMPLNFVIYELMSSGYGFKGDVVDSLVDALQKGEESTGKRFYSKEYVAYIDRGLITITPIREEDTCSTNIAFEQHRVYCGNSMLMFIHTDIDNIDNLNQPANIALLDMDKLTFPLTVRRWQDGDSFVPFGMINHKKLSDFLIDEKVSLLDKRRQFVVVSGEDIVWVLGRRIDNRYRIDTSTENVLKIVKETI